MPLGPSGRRNEPLNVIGMALALALAAALGATAGVVWHASGLGGEEEAPTERDQEAP